MWAKVDDGMWKHRKFRLLSLEARGLWVTALSHCGMEQCPDVDRDFLTFALAALDIDPEPVAAELVKAGLWDEREGGWTIHDWDEYQADSLSRQRAEAGKVGGLTRSLNAAQAKVQELEDRLSESADNSHESSNGKQTQASGQANAKHPPKHGPEPEPEPVPPSLPLDESDGVTADAVSGPDFDTWWDAYRDVARGRPTGYGNRKPAEKAWGKLSADERVKALEAVDLYGRLLGLEDADRDRPYPAQHGSTWLNRRTFDDVGEQLQDRRAAVKKQSGRPRPPPMEPADDNEWLGDIA